MSFPRLSRRGPIEADGQKAELLTAVEFPRLSRRGPIEARTPPAPLYCWPYFRVFHDAAPLKLILIVRECPHIYRFPRLSRRGPIEAHSGPSKPGKSL